MGPEIKVSLRSIGTVDVGIMARALGGGGHDHSAAAIIKGNLDSVIKTTVEKLHEMLLTTEAKESAKGHS
jgi:phosphoesterase RecJ-like protein